MKILLVKAYPRKTGYTSQITDLFVEGIKSTNAELKEVDLFSKDIAPCLGCYKCWTTTPGECVIKDDMDELIEDILSHDILYLSTPLYHYTMNCEMLKFLERTLLLTKQGYHITPLGTMRNGTRFPERWQGKKIGLITCGAFKKEENFSAITKTFELIANGMNFEICGELIRPESFLLPFDLAKPMTIAKIKTALKKAGKELGEQGFISQKTTEEVQTPIVESNQVYRDYANIYWDYKMQCFEEGITTDEKEIAAMVSRDPVILMRELHKYTDPVTTKKVKVIYYFHFTDRDLHFILKVDHGKSTLIEGEECSDYDLKVETDSKTWGAVFLRDIHPREALMQRKIILKGEKYLFSRIDKYFPPPSD